MTERPEIPQDDRIGWWPCACTKHDKQGNLTHIKTHAPSVKRCRVCKAERPEIE